MERMIEAELSIVDIRWQRLHIMQIQDMFNFVQCENEYDNNYVCNDGDSDDVDIGEGCLGGIDMV